MNEFYSRKEKVNINEFELSCILQSEIATPRSMQDK